MQPRSSCPYTRSQKFSFLFCDECMNQHVCQQSQIQNLPQGPQRRLTNLLSSLRHH
ncbi:MAG: hypothetical protein GYB54_02720 [Gammaproteobacteria bacterium]|nr:hypothetical protein [Gammaproteobacteria bacterium]